MKKYLTYVVALAAVLIFIASEGASAQSQTTISYAELDQLVKSAIKKEINENPENYLQMGNEAKNKGTSIIALYTSEAIKNLQARGVTITGLPNDSSSYIMPSKKYTMPEDLNAWFKAKGLSEPSRYTKNYYWTIEVDGDETALDLSDRLELPVDSLHQMALTFVRDYNRYHKRLRSSTWDEERELYRFFTSPYPKLKVVKGRQNVYRYSAQFHFPKDRHLTIKPIPPYNKEVEFAKNLQTYNGEFSFRWSSNVKYNDPGTAKYTYIPQPDGSRIFEGEFEYYRAAKRVDYYKDIEYAKIVGQMKNNKMVGHWEFELETDKEPFITMDFDEEGRLNGEVITKRYAAVFDHGVIREVYWHNGVYSTTGYFDGYGQPVGKWEIYRKNKPTIIIKYDQVGRRVSCGYRDNSTGDWHETANYDFVTSIPKEISYEVNVYLLRDTPKYVPKKDTVN